MERILYKNEFQKVPNSTSGERTSKQSSSEIEEQERANEEKKREKHTTQ